MIALSDNLLIQVSNAESKSNGGIIIPENAQVRKDKATVISVGDNVQDTRIKNGSVVYTVAGYSTKTPIEGTSDHFLIKESDILAFTEN